MIIDNPDGKDGLIGYARVSVHSQKEDTQIDDLKAAGCRKIFVDKGVSGKLAARPEFDACLAYLREGDTLIITRLSRAMRSMQHMLDLVNGTRGSDYTDGLKARGIDLKVLKQDIDTTTATGRLVFHIMAAFDEFLRELIVEGTNEGLASARARGRVGGAKPALSDEQVAWARKLLDERDTETGRQVNTPTKVAQLLGVARSTLYNNLDPEKRKARADRERQRYQAAKNT